MQKLTFENLETICQTLGTFAQARSQERPDKDLILTVKKINGQMTLQTTRFSEMPWFSRVIRWFGFGGASLQSVADFLHDYEPYVGSFAHLRNKSILNFHYTDKAMDQLSILEKEKWKELRAQKVKGCEVFKECISHHNRQHCRKVYLCLKDYGKTNLMDSGSFWNGSIVYSYPNPMGSFNEDADRLREKFIPPRLEANQFEYLDPFFKETQSEISSKVLGFCYEFGLGTKKNIDEAIRHYRIAAGQDEYSACYNLGRLLLEKNETGEAIDLLKKAEKIVQEKVQRAKNAIEKIRLQPSYVRDREIMIETPDRQETKEEYENRMEELQKEKNFAALYMKKWNKALQHIYTVLSEAYSRTHEELLKQTYLNLIDMKE